VRLLLAVLLLFASLPAQAMEKLGRARITYYWLVDESDAGYERSTRAAIKDVRGKVIARTSSRFRRHLLLEGSGRLRDGRVVTYQKHVAGEARFRVTKHSHGAAYGRCPLVPYRTIAVDPKFIKLGTKVYIPELEGTRLPDGTIHDGIFMAEDRSKYVRGAHIDIFTEAGSRSARPFTSRGYRTGSRVTLFRAAPPARNGCHTRR
jgi:3D (Asp-Asp-Asp) domain-containing protein